MMQWNNSNYTVFNSAFSHKTPQNWNGTGMLRDHWLCFLHNQEIYKHILNLKVSNNTKIESKPKKPTHLHSPEVINHQSVWYVSCQAPSCKWTKCGYTQKSLVLSCYITETPLWKLFYNLLFWLSVDFPTSCMPLHLVLFISVWFC